ncbi:hypothetical protein ABW19_dt0202118 [Dactylella cylindrospora]|nr:hypothetical protein ABW19_dt0202118 [Dactylella cylindrospora]
MDAVAIWNRLVDDIRVTAVAFYATDECDGPLTKGLGKGRRQRPLIIISLDERKLQGFLHIAELSKFGINTRTVAYSAFDVKAEQRPDGFLSQFVNDGLQGTIIVWSTEASKYLPPYTGGVKPVETKQNENLEGDVAIFGYMRLEMEIILKKDHDQSSKAQIARARSELNPHTTGRAYNFQTYKPLALPSIDSGSLYSASVGTGGYLEATQDSTLLRRPPDDSNRIAEEIDSRQIPQKSANGNGWNRFSPLMNLVVIPNLDSAKFSDPNFVGTLQPKYSEVFESYSNSPDKILWLKTIQGVGAYVASMVHIATNIAKKNEVSSGIDSRGNDRAIQPDQMTAGNTRQDFEVPAFKLENIDPKIVSGIDSDFFDTLSKQLGSGANQLDLSAAKEYQGDAELMSGGKLQKKKKSDSSTKSDKQMTTEENALDEEVEGVSARKKLHTADQDSIYEKDIFRFLKGQNDETQPSGNWVYDPSSDEYYYEERRPDLVER